MNENKNEIPKGKTWRIPRRMKCNECKQGFEPGTEMEWVEQDVHGRKANVLHCKDCARKVEHGN